MDPRYTGRPLSPPRRYGQPGRSSTSRLDAYPPDYESYYGPPRSSRESVVPGPRSSAERVAIPRSEPRHRDSLRSNSRDDYVVPPRRDPLGPPTRRPLSVITSSESPNRYRPAVSSAADIIPSPYKSRPRDDESYYIQPASSQHHHHRNFSAGGEDSARYLDPNRERRPEKGGYRSSGPSKGSSDYSRNLPQIREPRDSYDRDYGYEYTDKKEQAYRDLAAPRLRTRRGSDIGPRDRPYSVAGIEDLQRQSRDAGPPVTKRGFSKIDPNGTVRHEYRVPRENDPPSREHSLVRAGRDDRDSNKLRPSRGAVAVHQDNNDGNSSNVEDRHRERHHKHRRNESVDRERGPAPTRHYDERRFDERSKVHGRADSEDRFPRSHHHRDVSEDRYRPHAHRRRHGEREDDDGDKDRKYREEPRKEKHDKHEKHHDHKKLAEGLGIGAAGAAATGLVAEAIKHRHDKEGSDENEKDAKEKGRRHRRRDEADQENGSRSDETDDDRRERRRRRRREREEKERRDRGDEEAVAPKDSARPEDQQQKSKPTAELTDSGEENTRRSRRRHRREQRDSSESSQDETARRNKERSRVRVVSPPKEQEKKPKGILRPPTQKFPEDPAPVREGVAPLKEAGKKGIPPNARWTKIDRRLVNPEALELGNERYEERPDYVIVLRVLSKDEIEKYAEVTSELRDRHAKEDAPRAIETGPHHGDYSDDNEPPRQIAAVPYNQAEPLPVRDHSIANDIPSQAPPAKAETLVNATQQRATVVANGDGHEHQLEYDSDRPSLPSGGSYHRKAPPNVPPPTSSSIPVYPTMPPSSSALSQAQGQGPWLEQGRYMSPPPNLNPASNASASAPVNVQDPAASWHGNASGPIYPPVPGGSHSQGHTPPPPIPSKQRETERVADRYPAKSEGYQSQQ